MSSCLLPRKRIPGTANQRGGAAGSKPTSCPYEIQVKKAIERCGLLSSATFIIRIENLNLQSLYSLSQSYSLTQKRASWDTANEFAKYTPITTQVAQTSQHLSAASALISAASEPRVLEPRPPLSRSFSSDKTPDEPQEAGWAAYGGGRVTDDNPTDPCKCPECENVDDPQNDEDEPEHVAGPNCTCTQGYSGWRISLEEMRDITACVCLARKADDWRPEPGDEDFEKDAFSCFLTGVSKNGVSEFDLSDLEPAKHGVNEIGIFNWFPEKGRRTYRDIGDHDMAMPMHPKCFEIFKKESLQKFGKVDIDGLFLLRDDMPDDMRRFINFPQGTDHNIVLEQWYFHEPGTEYLAANPIDVPGLTTIINDCKGKHAEVVFAQTDHDTSSDPFALLSPELRLMILDLLPRQDVANLRLASSTFKQLPQSYFRKLVLHEMPWIWEVSPLQAQTNDLDWYRLWLALSAADGGALKDEEERSGLQQIRRDAYQRVQDELEQRGIEWGNEEYHRTFKEKAPNFDEQADGEIREAYASGRWPGKKSTEINGLRNCRRVWNDVQEILRRIEVKNRRGLREMVGSPED